MKKNIKMEDDDNNQKFDMSSPYVILIVIILLMWAFLRGTQPNIEINTADQILIYIIVGGLLWKSFETGIKNASPKAIGNGISTTTKGEPYCPFGIWDIFCINEIFGDGRN